MLSTFFSWVNSPETWQGSSNEPLSPRFWNAELELTYWLIKLSTGEESSATQFYWTKQLNFCLQNVKKQSQPESWELHTWWEFLGLRAWETASQETLRELLWGGKGGTRLYRSLQQRAGSLNIKRLLLNVAQLVKICLQCRRPEFDPWIEKIPWRRERLPTPVFWPGEFHGLYSTWGHKEPDSTEWLSLSLFTFKGNQIFQVKEFSIFLCKGRCYHLGSLKCSFHLHLSYLG